MSVLFTEIFGVKALRHHKNTWTRSMETPCMNFNQLESAMLGGGQASMEGPV